MSAALNITPSSAPGKVLSPAQCLFSSLRSNSLMLNATLKFFMYWLYNIYYFCLFVLSSGTVRVHFDFNISTLPPPPPTSVTQRGVDWSPAQVCQYLWKVPTCELNQSGNCLMAMMELFWYSALAGTEWANGAERKNNLYRYPGIKVASDSKTSILFISALNVNSLMSFQS